MEERRISRLSAGGSMWFLALSLAAQAAPAPLTPSDIGYIVVLEAGASVDQRARELVAAHGGEVGHRYHTAVQGFAFRGSHQAAQAIAAAPGVAYVEPDALTWLHAPKWCPDNPDHPACAGDEGGDTGGGGGTQIVPWGIPRVGGPLGPTLATAWVIDTGIDLDHPDLVVDVGRSVNFVQRGKNSPDDGHGHGTHVAGTIAAIDDGADVVGVAAGNVVVALRVLNNAGAGYLSDVVAAVDHVAANGADGDVVNMSLGFQSHRQSLHDAVIAAADGGIRFALSAGNDYGDASAKEPAHVEHANVYTVSAIDDADCIAAWSNVGAPVDFAAPGVRVESLARGGGTTTLSGTSMAAPHVAGLLLHGTPGGDGFASCDRDAWPDPIAHH